MSKRWCDKSNVFSVSMAPKYTRPSFNTSVVVVCSGRKYLMFSVRSMVPADSIPLFLFVVLFTIYNVSYYRNHWEGRFLWMNLEWFFMALYFPGRFENFLRTTFVGSWRLWHSGFTSNAFWILVWQNQWYTIMTYSRSKFFS